MERTYPVPDYVLRILNRLESGGYESFLVGGCVRDFLLSKKPKDYDIATSAKPHQIKALFSRTVDIGEKFGTIAVITGGKTIEVTTYRTDGEYTDARHPNNIVLASTLQEDCKRRDFTVNAMAYHPKHGLVDFFGGTDDLKNRLIRTVGEPELRFSEDALRILRAYRFSAQLDFFIEEKTRDAAMRLKDRLQKVSAERIREELLKILQCGSPDSVYALFSDKILPYRAHPQALSALPKRLRLGKFYLSINEGDRVRFLADMHLPKVTVRWLQNLEEISKSPYQHSRVSTKRLLSQFQAGTALDYAKIYDGQLYKYLRLILSSGEPYAIAQLAIDGDEIMKLGVSDGRKIGVILKELLDHCIEFPEDNTPYILKQIILKKLR